MVIVDIAVFRISLLQVWLFVFYKKLIVLAVFFKMFSLDSSIHNKYYYYILYFFTNLIASSFVFTKEEI